MSGCVTTFFGFLGYDEVCCMAGEAQSIKGNHSSGLQATTGKVLTLSMR